MMSLCVSFQTYNIQHGAIISLGHISANCVATSDGSGSTAEGESFIRRAIQRLSTSDRLNDLLTFATPFPHKHTHILTHTHTHIHTHTHTHTLTRPHTLMHSHTHTHTL